jgi:DNA mismatch repair ATPase MutL
MTSMGRVNRLSPLEAMKIESSANIRSLLDVAIALLKNSLDAKAQEVLICLDFHRCSCTVEDNGEGIPRKEFEMDGGLLKLHSMRNVDTIYPGS